MSIRLNTTCVNSSIYPNTSIAESRNFSEKRTIRPRPNQGLKKNGQPNTLAYMWIDVYVRIHVCIYIYIYTHIYSEERVSCLGWVFALLLLDPHI